MKKEPWSIRRYGEHKKALWLTLDNRKYPADHDLKDARPLLTMQITERFTEEELTAYLVIIRDRLNVEEVVEKLS